MGVASEQVKRLALAKLQSSGLRPQDISATVVDGADMGALGFAALPALKICYLDPLTRKPLRPRPHWPEFVRYRYLVDPPSSGKKKPMRYTQPANTGTCAFFPHTVNWQEVFDELQPIYITEGELKAAKACERGFPTIGLGGVYNYQSQTTGFLPELEAIRWPRRKVTIIYDSDIRDKPEVCEALNKLAQELEQRGAVPYTVVLPNLMGDAKTGLDDYFVMQPDAEEFSAYCRANEQVLTLAQPLWRLNELVTYIHDPGFVARNDTGQLLSVEQFKTAFGNRLVPERVLLKNGSVSLKQKPVADAWLHWPMRRDAQRLIYSPGKAATPQEYNTWRGWKSTPKKGDVSLFLQLIDHLFYTAPKEIRDWFLRWLAYPIQHPGAKLYTAAVLFGARKGTGKSFVGYCMREIYGDNFREIKQSDLHGNFTGWAKDRQFILGDEITGTDKRQQADQLKSLITQKELKINIKYVPEFTVPDCVNYLFTSNQPDAFFLEDGDRRFFVHEVTVEPLPLEFYHRLQDWVESEAGRNALHHYLLNLPLSDFDPRNPAPMTAAKEVMTSLGRSEIAAWIENLLANPDTVLRFGMQPIDGDLFSSRDLLMLYDPARMRGASANAIARALKRAHVPMVLDGQPVRYRDQQERFFALRNPDRWARAKRAEVVKHLERTKPKGA